MDAGVFAPAPQILFSLLDGGALTYSSNGQFQMSPGSPSEQRGVPPHGDTNSGGEGVSVSEESSALQESKAVTEQPASRPSLLPESFASSTPSLTRGRKPPLTTTTSVNELFSNQIPTLSPRSSLPLFRISTEIQSLSTSSSRPLSASKSVSPSSFSQRDSVSGSSTTPLSSNDCARYLGYSCSSPVNSTPMGSSTAMPTARIVTIAPAVPAKLSSFGVQAPSWYLAVIFGTIGGVALLIFFITVITIIYRRAKRRRMAQSIDVPWAATPGDEELFFGSRDLSSRNVNTAINFGEPKDGPLHTANRDLGVPDDLGANGSGYSLYNHPIPGSRLFFDDTLPPGSEELNLGHQFRPTNALRLLPSHLIDEDLAARARQGDSAYFSGRPAGLRRRSHGHLDGAVEVNPYINPPEPMTNERNTTSAAPKPQPLIDRLRNLGNHDKASWDRLPTPGRDQPKEDHSEPWASSFKASFLGAFNALASGLKPSGENGPDGDRLTRLPTRHRPTIRHTGMAPLPRRSSTKSPAWILHEKDDGTGTVQFLPRLEKHHFGTPTPEKLVPVLSISRGRTSPISIDENGSFRRTERLIYPRAPFLPATAVHPHREKYSPFSTRRNPISRDSSIYSTSSSATSKYDPPAAPASRRFTGIDPHSLDVVVLEPDILSR